MKDAIVVLVGLVLLCGGSCAAPFVDISESIAGFTETDASGNVISVDADDWRVQRLYAGKIKVTPVYPNPTASGSVTIKFETDLPIGISGIIVYVQTDEKGYYTTVARIANVPQYGFVSETVHLASAVNASVFVGKLVRVLFYDFEGRLISYGDVRFG